MSNISEEQPRELPKGSMFTKFVTQQHLDEATRALGRPMWDYEVKILDDLLEGNERANAKRLRKGELKKVVSMDEVIAVFVWRIQKFEGKKITADLLNGRS